ncbi:hypothetical protein DFH08DRAFT_1074935 [Mycena albidolilacea]|uniref:Uncharacterized protein n=1 Tax=Mycena albidolilacea TaxID=1033008 RepID=A0AAD7AI46_9AGAR|nr:hypothetical protein DFH08DRAFT_1074935 [Mycena albidolilacea]
MSGMYRVNRAPRDFFRIQLALKSAESHDQKRLTAIDSDRKQHQLYHNNPTTLFFPTSLMADVILLESSVPFNAAEWIGVGKLYKDVPIEVSDACCDARTIPADLQATFTSRATPIRKSWRSGYHRLTGGDYGWERWQALASRAVYRIIDVPGFDGDSDDEDEEEEEYEEPEEGSGGKKRKPKPPRGAVKRKKTDGTKQSKSGANKAPSKRRKVANAAKTAEKGRALSSKVFRAFGGLFVLFGGSFYVAKRIVNTRKSNEWENARAQQQQGHISTPKNDKS